LLELVLEGEDVVVVYDAHLVLTLLFPGSTALVLALAEDLLGEEHILDPNYRSVVLFSLKVDLLELGESLQPAFDGLLGVGRLEDVTVAQNISTNKSQVGVLVQANAHVKIYKYKVYR
jgi:hypothetical protein